MKPVIAVVGRPNVGKSTLFNRLTRSRDAIVHGAPGVTRDRHDGRSGLAAADREIAQKLRKQGTRVWLTVNKTEGMARDAALAEFHEIGLGVPAAISAAHGEGVRELLEAVLEEFPEESDEESRDEGHPRIAIVGRPNAGKSTLVNALVGEERVIAFAEPGTTRDAIEVPFERAGRRYTLIDTAGLRRRGKTGEAVERLSIVKALQAIEAANVAVLVLDAVEGLAEQDAHVAGYILERGRAVVVAVNKWDAADKEARARIKQELVWKLGFLGFAETHFISAKEGRGLGALMRSVDAAYAAAMAKLSTPKLTRALIAAVERQAPPRKKGPIRPKLRYAHQGGRNPPRIIIHGSALDRLPETYKRYLEGYFRNAFKLVGTPLAIEFRAGRNPFAGRER